MSVNPTPPPGSSSWERQNSSESITSKKDEYDKPFHSGSIIREPSGLFGKIKQLARYLFVSEPIREPSNSGEPIIYEGCRTISELKAKIESGELPADPSQVKTNKKPEYDKLPPGESLKLVGDPVPEPTDTKPNKPTADSKINDFMNDHYNKFVK